MKTLLENDFALRYGDGGQSYSINTLVKSEFLLGDYHACNQCRPFFKMGCDHVIFHVVANNEVVYIPIEDFINQFPELSDKERCDVLLYDEQKIVLADMFCGMSGYAEDHLREGKMVIGKKAKVFNQIESTLDILYTIPTIATLIDSKVSKIGVFACRLVDMEHFISPSQMSSSMNMFLHMNRHLSQKPIAIRMKHGFEYVTCRYADVYQW